MNIDYLISDFKKKYKVLDIIDLYDRALKNRLTAIRQDQFANNERILITQLKEDEYDYADQPGKFLSELQQHLRVIDISNSFVVIITGNADIDSELAQVRRQFSVDDLSISSCIIDKEYNKKIKKFEDTYCVLPWMHLYAGPNGDVLPCCMADQNLPMGNLFNNSVNEIMFGNVAQQLRSNMVNNLRSKSCESCYKREDSGLPSMRISSVQKNKQYISTDVNSYTPISLRIELNHLCNFKCRMCNEWLSSSIAHETKAMYGADAKLPYHYIGINQLDPRQRELAVKKILNILNNVKDMGFGGGEPLLSQEHYDIMSRLIDLEHTDIEISYYTNLSKLFFRNIKVTDLWQKFNNITVNASVDASGTVAEYIRHGTIWKDIVANITQIKDECPDVQLNITSAVGFLNVQNLILLQQDWISTNFIPADSFKTNCLTTPVFLSVAALPTHHKTRLKEVIQGHLEWCVKKHVTSLLPAWKNIINYMMANDYSSTLQEFRSRMKSLDLYRGESFVDTFPEFEDLY